MYIVLDIGGTFIKYALMDSTGNIYSKGKQPTPKDNLSEFEHRLFSIIEEHDLANVKGIAVCCPGIVDVGKGTIYHGGFLPFLHEVNLAKKLEDKYKIEVFMENDAKCAALAELWLGSIKDVKNAVVLVLGSGVGGAIIIDGKLYRGINFSAGEVSYVIQKLDHSTRKGQYFGLDCSAVDMVNDIGNAKNLDQPIDGETVFEYIKQNDPEAMAIFDKFCLSIAAQIMNLQYTLDPERFAIGGGISSQPILIERINWAINELKEANPMHLASPNVVTCKLKNDANLYGALYNFLVNNSETIPV